MRFMLILLLLVSCGESSNESDPTPTRDDDRPLNEVEYEIWELTIGCFMDSGIEPYVSMGYVEPTILVKDPISGDDECGSTTASGCARLTDNIVVINSRTYFRLEPELPVTLLVHEFKHLILYQAGVPHAENYDHTNEWFAPGSPCPNDFLLEGQNE